MTVTVSTADPRSLKAVALLATADQWTKGHRKGDGRAFFAIPGSEGHVYWTDTRECTCPDFVNRGVACKHVLAVRLWTLEQKAEQPARRAPLVEMTWKPCRCGALVPPEQPGSVCGNCLEHKPGALYREIYGDE